MVYIIFIHLHYIFYCYWYQKHSRHSLLIAWKCYSRETGKYYIRFQVQNLQTVPQDDIPVPFPPVCFSSTVPQVIAPHPHPGEDLQCQSDGFAYLLWTIPVNTCRKCNMCVCRYMVKSKHGLRGGVQNSYTHFSTGARRYCASAQEGHVFSGSGLPVTHLGSLIWSNTWAASCAGLSIPAPRVTQGTL